MVLERDSPFSVQDSFLAVCWDQMGCIARQMSFLPCYRSSPSDGLDVGLWGTLGGPLPRDGLGQIRTHRSPSPPGYVLDPDLLPAVNLTGRTENALLQVALDGALMAGGPGPTSRDDYVVVEVTRTEAPSFRRRRPQQVRLGRAE